MLNRAPAPKSLVPFDLRRICSSFAGEIRRHSSREREIPRKGASKLAGWPKRAEDQARPRLTIRHRAVLRRVAIPDVTEARLRGESESQGPMEGIRGTDGP